MAGVALLDAIVQGPARGKEQQQKHSLAPLQVEADRQPVPRNEDRQQAERCEYDIGSPTREHGQWRKEVGDHGQIDETVDAALQLGDQLGGSDADRLTGTKVGRAKVL